MLSGPTFSAPNSMFMILSLHATPLSNLMVGQGREFPQTGWHQEFRFATLMLQL